MKHLAVSDETQIRARMRQFGDAFMAFARRLHCHLFQTMRLLREKHRQNRLFSSF